MADPTELRDTKVPLYGKQLQEHTVKTSEAGTEMAEQLEESDKGHVEAAAAAATKATLRSHFGSSHLGSRAVLVQAVFG